MQVMVPEKLRGQIENAAQAIKKALEEGKPVLVRHHGDADGVVGGIAFKRALESLGKKAWFYQSNTAYYRQEDAQRDAAKLAGAGVHKPLAVLVDFAGNEESIPSLKILREAGAQIVLIDHHPTRVDVSEFVDVMASPWNAGVGSEYTAGFLACLVAEKVGKVEAVEELERTSLTADKSTLVKWDEESLRRATVLDYLVGKSKRKNAVEAGDAILKDEKEVKVVFAEAEAKLQDAVEKARRKLTEKKFENGFIVALIKLGKALDKGEFPSRGKICGVIHDRIDAREKAPVVTIGYAGDVLNFRANQKARDRGFKANVLISEFKNEFRNAVEAGGGHEGAAGLKLREGFEKIALEFFLRKIQDI